MTGGVQKYNKAGAACLGAAIAGLIGYYLDWPVEVQGFAATIAAGALTVIGPANKP